MPEEFKWDINWDDVPEDLPPDKLPQQRSAPPAKPNGLPATPEPQPPGQPAPGLSGQAPPLKPASATPISSGTKLDKPAPVTPASTGPAQAEENRPSQPPSQESQRILRAGERIDLTSLGCPNHVVDIAIRFLNPGLAIACIGLDARNSPLGASYVVTSRNRTTPCAAIKLWDTQGYAAINFDLPRAPKELTRLFLIAESEAADGLLGLGQGAMSISNDRTVRAKTDIFLSQLAPQVDPTHSAMVLAEFYRRDGAWRLCTLPGLSAQSLSSLVGTIEAQTPKQ